MIQILSKLLMYVKLVKDYIRDCYKTEMFSKYEMEKIYEQLLINEQDSWEEKEEALDYHQRVLLNYYYILELIYK